MAVLAEGVGKQPVTALQLVVDGRPYPGPAGTLRFKDPKPGKVEGVFTVTLDAEVLSLAVVARTAVSEGYGALGQRGMKLVAPPPTKKQQPNLYVLAVGINQYPAAWKLNCAVQDAEGLCAAFAKNSKAVFGKVYPEILPDKKGASD